MTINITINDDYSEVYIIFDDSSVLRATRYGDEPNDLKFVNFNKIEDDEICSSLKTFVKSILFL